MGKRANGRRVRGRRRLLLATLAVLLAAPGWALPAAVPPPAAAATGPARIAHSEDGVNLRAEPSYGARVLGTLPDGEPVTLRTDQLDTVYDPDGATRWWPVETGLGSGWVAGFFLEVDGEQGVAPVPPAAAAAPAEAATDVGSAAGLEAGASLDLYGWTARVAEPDGVNFRAEPGLAGGTLRALKLDTLVELRIDEADTVYLDGSRWWPVRVEDAEGWVAGSYLAPYDGEVTAGGGAPADAAAEPAGKQAAALELFAAGSYVAAVTDDGTGLNIRADGAPDAERIGAIPELDVVQVMEGPYSDPLGNGWYVVTDGEVTGFVDGRYLQKAGQPDDPNAPGPGLGFPEAPDVADVLGLATGSFQYPLKSFTFTQGFGCSPYWFEPWVASIGCNFHNAIDLAAPMGTPLEAADGGIVEQAGWCDCGLGYYVKIDHGNGFKTIYGHMSEYYATPGQAIAKGDVIGAVGSTGNSTGPHVHFTVEYLGVDQDPLAYL